MPPKGKCADCRGGFFECKLKEVKELPSKHYCHSSCIVAMHEDMPEEICCLRCGHRIPPDWLKKTVHEIEEQQRIDEGVDYREFYSEFSLRAMDTIKNHFNWLQFNIDKHGINYNSETLGTLLSTWVCCKRC